MKVGKCFFITATILVLIIFFSYFLFLFLFLDEKWDANLANFGVFGDSFGVLTSLFSALTILGLIYTVNLQREDLSISHEELALTRKELKEQKEEMKLQNETLGIQKFEKTLFNIIDLFIKSRNEINIGDYKGTIAIKEIYNLYLYNKFKNRYEYNLDIKQDIFLPYSNLYRDYGEVLDQYFRMLHNIIIFIETSFSVDNDLYINLVKLLLSDYEKALLFYYCIDNRKLEIKPLVIKYKILEHLNKKVIYSHHQKCLNEFK